MNATIILIPLSSFSCLFSQALNYRSWIRSTLGPMHRCVCVRVIWIVYACGCVCAMYIFVACECAGDIYASNTYLALECFHFFCVVVFVWFQQGLWKFVYVLNCESEFSISVACQVRVKWTFDRIFVEVFLFYELKLEVILFQINKLMFLFYYRNFSIGKQEIELA